MNNVGEKYLPIGTVVMLSGGSKRVMITGFCSMAAEDEENQEMFDYAGCMYPEGFISSDQTALFNHSQIEKVYHLGLVDDEEKQFKTTLNALVAQMNGETVAPTVQTVSQAVEQPVEAPVPPVGPGLPGYVAPTPVAPVQPVVPVAEQPVEVPVPPVGPGLPGYVAPTPVVPVQPVVPATPVMPQAVEQPVEAPASDETATPNYRFDENGVLISA